MPHGAKGFGGASFASSKGVGQRCHPCGATLTSTVACLGSAPGPIIPGKGCSKNGKNAVPSAAVSGVTPAVVTGAKGRKRQIGITSSISPISGTSEGIKGDSKRVFNANLKRRSLRYSMGTVTHGLIRSVSMPKEDRFGDVNADDRELCVSGLLPDCNELDLYKVFAPFGALQINGISVMKLPNGDCNGSAFVRFLDPTEAHRAIATLHKHELPDRTELNVDLRKKNYNKMSASVKGTVNHSNGTKASPSSKGTTNTASPLDFEPSPVVAEPDTNEDWPSAKNWSCEADASQRESWLVDGVTATNEVWAEPENDVWRRFSAAVIEKASNQV